MTVTSFDEWYRSYTQRGVIGPLTDEAKACHAYLAGLRAATKLVCFDCEDGIRLSGDNHYHDNRYCECTDGEVCTGDTCRAFPIHREIAAIEASK